MHARAGRRACEPVAGRGGASRGVAGRGGAWRGALPKYTNHRTMKFLHAVISFRANTKERAGPRGSRLEPLGWSAKTPPDQTWEEVK